MQSHPYAPQISNTCLCAGLSVCWCVCFAFSVIYYLVLQHLSGTDTGKKVFAGDYASIKPSHVMTHDNTVRKKQMALQSSSEPPPPLRTHYILYFFPPLSFALPSPPLRRLQLFRSLLDLEPPRSKTLDKSFSRWTIMCVLYLMRVRTCVAHLSPL